MGCTSKLENCSPLAQFCAVKVPPKFVLNRFHAKLEKLSPNYCTDLYGLKGSSRLHY